MSSLSVLIEGLRDPNNDIDEYIDKQVRNIRSELKSKSQITRAAAVQKLTYVCYFHVHSIVKYAWY